MQATRYSQASGFEDVMIDDSLCPWPNHYPEQPKLREGWETIEKIPTESWFCRELEAWQTGDEKWPVIATLESNGWVIVFSSRADFTTYWHKFVGPCAAAQTELMEQMYRLAAKMFQAAHGHNGEEICEVCDPYGALEEKNPAARESSR